MTDGRWPDSSKGFGFRYVDDGDPYVYIKTTWGTLGIRRCGADRAGCLAVLKRQHPAQPNDDRVRWPNISKRARDPILN